jgi:hypothetical protein
MIMEKLAKHIVILPYYCGSEIARYLKIAKLLTSFPEPAGGYHFLLASSPKTKPSFELYDAYSKLGNVIPFACPSQVFGYPQGPTAMFWDCMDYLATQFSGQSGFALWMESDMAPSQPDWIDRLSAEWFGTANLKKSMVSSEQLLSRQSTNRSINAAAPPIMMGCYVPKVYKHRVFKQKKLILHAHINGGACYSMDFAMHMPAAARSGVFDMAVFDFAQQLGRIRATRQIAFSTLSRVRRDLQDPSKVLLHGFMQHKDRFIDHCCHPVTDQEKRAALWHPWLDRWETVQRKIRVQFVRRGQKAMLENMFLAKHVFDRTQLESDR